MVDKRFDEYFGFTKEEVKSLFDSYKKGLYEEKKEDLKEICNGFRIGT